MSQLKNTMKTFANYTLTENGALTNRSTHSHVLDLFALGGAANGVNLSVLIENALSEDPRLAIKVIFYLADIRQGQGRRAFFRLALKEVLLFDVEVARQLLAFIPEYGRWDYLYWFMGTTLQADALELMGNEVVRSSEENKPSLVFKWLASADASSAETKRNAAITRKFFDLTPKEYRQVLSKGRKMLGDAVVERHMSAKEWLQINYEKVPSVAMKKYRKAFINHSPEHFNGFIKAVQSGEKKINSSVLYPSDIIHAGTKTTYQWSGGVECVSGLERATLVEQWKALPNYVSPNVRALAVVDTSASMRILPLEVATSLGIYLSERAPGIFHNAILSFSRTARIFDLPKGDVFDKYTYLYRQNICENTNLQSVFDLILYSAVHANVPANEMPNRIIIISDMQFDGTGDKTNLDVIRQKYAMTGYEFPQIIFWTVNATTLQSPATMNEAGVILVSGYSPAVLKAVLSDEPFITPYKAMLAVINTPRYEFVDALAFSR